MRSKLWPLLLLSIAVFYPGAERLAAQDSQSSATAAPDDATQPDQPMSLGEFARRERAKKSSEPKAVKIFNDDNMPRALLSTGDKAPDLGVQGSMNSSKATLIDFWASWCGVCREALPGLKQLRAAYGDQLEVISVDEDDDAASGNAFAVRNGITWTQRFDENHQMMRRYGANAVPTYVLIGSNGAVVQEYVGDDPGEPLTERIGPDLKESMASPQ
ncbi:MAG: TlpA disulfide reductase family protein [Candidatus Acidiferrales bacterium]